MPAMTSRLKQISRQLLLEMPVEELAEQIARYVGTQAPPGWRDGAAKDEDGVHTPSNEDYKGNEA